MWLILIISLPGASGALRMRVWRALKAHGVGILRDGVYLLPASADARTLLQRQADDVIEAGGSAWVMASDEQDPKNVSHYETLFSRTEQYGTWSEELRDATSSLKTLSEPQARRRIEQLRRKLDAIQTIDYFPDDEYARATAAMTDFVRKTNAIFSPDEPVAQPGEVVTRDPVNYANRIWATRSNLWIDRVASAWLIRRFIDPDARFTWADDVKELDDDVVGFDFDGAEFTHVGQLVTFEVLIESFELVADPALRRMSTLIHDLDVGGVPVAESAGMLALLSGARERAGSDNDFVTLASEQLDNLYTAFTNTPDQESRKQ